MLMATNFHTKVAQVAFGIILKTTTFEVKTSFGHLMEKIGLLFISTY